MSEQEQQIEDPNCGISFYGTHRGLFLEGRPFIPLIAEDSKDSEECHAVCIKLPAFLDSDLLWDEQMHQAELLVSRGKYLVWDLQLGLESEEISFFDPVAFQSWGIALQEFSRVVWKKFRASTWGVILFRGCIYEQDMPFPERVGALQLCADYLHRLASYLPDTLPIFLLWDASACTRMSEVAILLSAERFTHFQLGVRGTRLMLSACDWQTGHGRRGWIGVGSPPTLAKEAEKGEVKVGIVIPGDDVISQEVMSLLDEVLKFFVDGRIGYRLVPEGLLNEQWDDLDSLILFVPAMTTLGKRKVLGFLAAGGRVITVGGTCGLGGEMSWEEWQKSE